MATELFEQQAAKAREAFGTGLGADAGVFVDDRLSIVERPELNWGYVVNGASFARGTLVAVAPALLEFARANAPAQHRDALGAQYLRNLRHEARRAGLGEALQAFAGSICWSLSHVPARPVLPPGFRFEAVDREWLNAEIPAGRFENGAGPADGGGGRSFRNSYGVSILDERGEIAALAGVFDTYGLSEIGVDVVPSYQGRGLGVAVVAAAVYAILDRGETPFYGCAPTNIRSQHTALASGFMPVCSDGTIS
jgi:GNAT superfamily N-acetyltransferase